MREPFSFIFVFVIRQLTLSDLDNSDLDQLLEPDTTEAAQARKREEKSVMRKQWEYFYGETSLRKMVFTLIITFADCALMIAEIIVEGGIRPGSHLFSFISVEEHLFLAVPVCFSCLG